ncbi:uncharacterized protein LOC143428049 [Xylocopa sonorina]|uniref:uncharacterized protein LOC143428049 n=1 Tax=Xylocopa sonorina TaxID=1818115 RepID=UPI00403AFBC8
MELLDDRQVNDSSLTLDANSLQISCNWQITNNKQFCDAFRAIASPQEFQKTNFEEVVSLETCIYLEPTEFNSEPCMLDIKLTKGQRISQIAVVSEANVLEFFKQYGEYETTKFAELVDVFEDISVYFAETAILPQTTEASIKFTKMKTKNTGLWIYGIRLYLTEPKDESKNFSTKIFNPEIIKNFLAKFNFNDEGNDTTNGVQSHYTKIVNTKSKNTKDNNGKEMAQSIDENTVSNNKDILMYIDKKFQDMEAKMMRRIDEMEQRTNQKLDIILNQLEIRCRPSFHTTQ